MTKKKIINNQQNPDDLFAEISLKEKKLSKWLQARDWTKRINLCVKKIKNFSDVEKDRFNTLFSEFIEQHEIFANELETSIENHNKKYPNKKTVHIYSEIMNSAIEMNKKMDFLKKRAKDMENSINVIEKHVKDIELTDNKTRNVFPFKLVE